jgi:ankyrin repeat protein
MAKAAMELVLAGADVNSRSSSGDTPLTWASLMGLEDVALELLARGSDVDTHVRGQAVVMTPLAFATREGHARLRHMVDRNKSYDTDGSKTHFCAIAHTIDSHVWGCISFRSRKLHHHRRDLCGECFKYFGGLIGCLKRS